jgi:hypothetical protein
MSPEVRNFAISKEQQAKIDVLRQGLDKLNELPHNYSNTARTMDKLTSGIAGSSLSMISMMMGHNPGISMLMGSLIKPLAKDAPDAVRLGLLKFLGSSAEINPGALKSAVDMIQATMKGDSLIARSAKNVFSAGKEVLPASFMPKEADRNRLDKRLKDLQNDPNSAMQIGGNIGHYMPDHGQHITQTVAGAASYLNGLRPGEQRQNPFDTKMKPATYQQAAFNRQLDLAEQPLMIMKHIQDGTVSSQDINTVKTLYPAVYSRLQEKVTHEMMNASSKGISIPYSTRLGLSKLLGQPLDSTMTPQAIQATQPQPKQQPQPAPKNSALNKLGKMYQTQGQSAEQDRSGRE